MAEKMEGYLTVHEAARRLGRSTEQVRRYLREGKLEGRRIGGQWFIREAAVLYRTKSHGEQNMWARDSESLEGSKAVIGKRRAALERLDSHRVEIRRRLEELGVRIDPVALIHEIREEEP